jgi:medium-chain acyl-[acyl-carrier-protein] hydrolase
MEPPGRWARFRDPPLTSVEQLVASVAKDIGPYLDKPFVLMGYSVGAVVAFELARRLRGEMQQEPVCLFVTACGAPHLLPAPHLPVTHNLPDSKFVETLISFYDGLPRAVVEDSEMLSIIIPIARADLTAFETYVHVPQLPLSCPIAAFGGDKDRAAYREVLDPWRIHTTGKFSLHMFPGGHFFINTAQKQMLQIISESLSEVVK